ncbi:MAG: hypothetical protein ACYCWN_08635 [Ferrimicrobium sp.]
MKNIFKTAGAILAAGAILSACGSSGASNTSGTGTTTSVSTYGWRGTKLYLPHVGFATAAITKFAHSDPAYVKQAINPKDWHHSRFFGRYIFVGPFTSGIAYEHIKEAKITAWAQAGTPKWNRAGLAEQTIVESPVGLITHAMVYKVSGPAIPGICIPAVPVASSKEQVPSSSTHVGGAKYYVAYSVLEISASNTSDKAAIQNATNCTSLRS